MFSPRDRVTIRSHAGQDRKAIVVVKVNEAGAYLVRTSSGRLVVSSQQMTRRINGK